MAFRRRRSTFRGSTGCLGWISWNRSGKDRTLGLGRCLRPLSGFRILGRVALETLLDWLVEKQVSDRAASTGTSDGNRIGKGSRPLFTRRRCCGISAVLTRYKRFENPTAKISARKRRSPREPNGLRANQSRHPILISRLKQKHRCSGSFRSISVHVNRKASPKNPARRFA